MENFKSSGIYTKQAHVKIPEGLFEEEHGRKGFFGRVSHLYHQNRPTGWTQLEGALKPRLLPSLFSHPNLQNQFECLFTNADVRLSCGHFDQNPPDFWRNADFDELYFLHEGSARCETTYGHMELKKGDYFILPRGTTYKFYFQNPCSLLLLESASEFEQPDRGLLGPNALYDQTAISVPEAAIGSEQNLSKYRIKIKREGQYTFLTYPYNPLDVKGWKGSIYPWKLSIYDFCPINSHRYHIPPSGHTTFVARNFVVCSFVARPLEHTSEGVLKVPFYHSNIDFDEILFYHQGNFFSRDNIESGAFTFHPQGIHHGPHPKASQKANDKEWTDEFAVMIDTRYPLSPTNFSLEVEMKEYWKSWMEKTQ